MTVSRDPRRGHPSHEPTDPPPHVPGVPGVPLPPAARRSTPEIEVAPLPPAPAPPSQRPAWFVHWSPGSIAAAVVAVIVALGGAQGIRELLGASAATQAAIAASEARILARLEEHRIDEQRAHDEIRKSITLEGTRINLLSAWAARVNQGAPHPSWPQLYTLTPPPAGAQTPLWVTSMPWPDPTP